MVDARATKICGTFLFLSGVLGLALAPVAMRIGYPLFADFGNGEMLLRFASTWPAPLWFDLMQVSVPALMLAAAPGFFYLLRSGGSLVVLGVVLTSLGLVFTTAQDGVELTLVVYLPRAYATADAAARPALLAIGGAGSTAMGVFAGVLGILGFVGLAMINWSMIELGGRLKLMGSVGLAAILIILIAGLPAALSIPFAFTNVGFPVGFITLRLWMIVMGVTMFRWRPAPT
jgi:hypothetical protein